MMGYDNFNYGVSDDYEIMEDVEPDGEADSLLDDMNEAQDAAFSTVPVPTYNKNNRIDYVQLVQDYRSDDKVKKDRAAEAVIQDLTGLVFYIIKKKYANYAARYYDDLVQSGELGILAGLKDYDPSKSLPATYFYYYIVHEIQCFINDNVYKTTPYYSANMKKINRAIAKFENANRPYTNKDISIQTGIPLDTVETAMGIIHGNTEVSLSVFGDQIEGAYSPNPEDEYVKKEKSEYLYKMMKDTLTKEEILVVSYLYGIGGLETLSLKAIAKRLNVPIDRIKKVKTSAFCKLRNSKLSNTYPSAYKDDFFELDAEDSIALFPRQQAIDSANELNEIELEC